MEPVEITYADFLRELRRHPKPKSYPVICDPILWNGSIDVTHPSNIFARTLRALGKKLKWFRLYKMGLKISYFIGLKYMKEMLDEY